jgi:hypothetical protein
MTKLVNQMIENKINLLIERRQRGKGGINNRGLTVYPRGNPDQA